MSQPTEDAAKRLRELRWVLAVATAQEGPPLRFLASYPGASGLFDGMPTVDGPVGIVVQQVRT